MSELKVSNSVIYRSKNGGTLTLLETTTDLENTGVEDGWPFFDDVYLNPGHDLTIDVDGKQTVALETDYGEPVIEFSIVSSVPNGVTSFKFDDLEPDEWHRLLIDGKLAQTETATAHGKSSKSGKIRFEKVIISND